MTKEKTFDAVKMHRDIREKISAATENMSFDELMKYIRQRLKKTGTKPIGRG